MVYVIGGSCIDVTDKSCVEVCPVDCIYEGGRKLYIQPTECIDCGACESVCPVSAISDAADVLGPEIEFVDDNRRFFAEVLPGRDTPLDSPQGARDVGRLAVDTPLVTRFAAREAAAD